MTLPQHADQMLFGDVSISLRSRDRCVTEKLLNNSYVDTIPQEQSRYSVRNICGVMLRSMRASFRN
jgi:hypothetical protein